MTLKSGPCTFGRATSLPSSRDLPRRSFDCQAQPSLRRRASIDQRTLTRTKELPLSRTESKTRDGVCIEVGQAVDIDEQIRRLDELWTREEESVSVEAEPQAEFSGRQESQGDGRLHLEQRWQALEGKSAKSGVSRRGGIRRRQLDLSGKPVHSLRASRLRRSRMQTGATRKPVFVLHKTAKQGAEAGVVVVPGEVADAEYLTQVTARVHVSDSNMSASDAVSLMDSKYTNWGKAVLLTREEELRLGSMVQADLASQRRVRERSEEVGRQLMPRECAALLGVSEETLDLRSRNAKHAHNLFMQCNVRLVTTVARKFEGRGVEMEDMMMEGTVGLGRAIELYDPAKGFRFSTYAYQWIRQAVGKSITEHGRIVRLPSHVFEMVSRIQKVRASVAAQRGGDPPGDAEVAATLGISLEKVQLYSQAGRPAGSLEDPMDSHARPDSGPEGGVLGDVLEDPRPTAYDQVMQAEGARMMKEDINSVLEGLSIRERNVLRFRYGMHSEQLSLHELSNTYGITKERVRQIGEIALAKLQLRQESRGQPGNGRKRRVPYLKPENYRI